MYWLILESSALSLICDISPAACQLEPQLMLDRETNEIEIEHVHSSQCDICIAE